MMIDSVFESQAAILANLGLAWDFSVNPNVYRRMSQTSSTTRAPHYVSINFNFLHVVNQLNSITFVILKGLLIIILRTREDASYYPSDPSGYNF